MNYSLLKDLAPHTQKWRVKVRVVRFSEFLSSDDPPKINRLDFILLDEQGTTMECQIPGHRLPTYRDTLKEDSVYMIESFEISNARSMYRPVQHPFMARFTKFTKINEVPTIPETFPLYACSIVPFSVLRNERLGVKEYLSDAVGIITECSPVTTQSTKTGDKRAMRKVFITDGSETASVALWSQHAHRFEADRIVSMSRQAPVTILFAGVTAGWFSAQLQLQASPICRWYINPTLPETAALIDRYGHLVGPVQCSQPHFHTSVGGPATVAELAKLDDPHEIWGNKYVVVVEIKSLLPGQPWRYMACDKCFKKSKPYGTAYRCTDYACTGTTATPRYRLNLLGVEPDSNENPDSPTVDLICFGPTAEELIRVRVDLLLESNSGAEDSVPPPISRLFGKQYRFCLSVPKAALGRDRTSFKIDAIETVQPKLAPPANTGAAESSQNMSDHRNDCCAATLSSTPAKGIVDQPEMHVQTRASQSHSPMSELATPTATKEGSYQEKAKKPRVARKLILNNDDESTGSKDDRCKHA